MAKKVVTFGEIMLRLAPEGYYRFVQATSYGATYGGGEANVAVSLANYGMDASFVTKLPAHEIGQAGVNALRQYGVDTSDIVRGGDRVGIYFLEKGASQRPSKCNNFLCHDFNPPKNNVSHCETAFQNLYFYYNTEKQNVKHVFTLMQFL